MFHRTPISQVCSWWRLSLSYLCPGLGLIYPKVVVIWQFFIAVWCFIFTAILSLQLLSMTCASLKPELFCVFWWFDQDLLVCSYLIQVCSSFVVETCYVSLMFSCQSPTWYSPLLLHCSRLLSHGQPFCHCAGLFSSPEVHCDASTWPHRDPFSFVFSCRLWLSLGTTLAYVAVGIPKEGILCINSHLALNQLNSVLVYCVPLPDHTVPEFMQLGIVCNLASHRQQIEVSF